MIYAAVALAVLVLTALAGAVILGRRSEGATVEQADERAREAERLEAEARIEAAYQEKIAEEEKRVADQLARDARDGLRRGDVGELLGGFGDEPPAGPPAAPPGARAG